MTRQVEWHGPIEDAVVRRAREERMTQLISSMPPLDREILASLVGGISLEKVRIRYGLTADEVQHAGRSLLSKMRHPARFFVVSDYLDGEEELTFGRATEEAIRRLLEEFRPRCAHCDQPAGPLRFGGAPGRPRKWCSSACKQAAYRLRRDAKQGTIARTAPCTVPPPR